MVSVINYRKELRDEILWSLTEVMKLEELRNNVIHSPILEKSDKSVESWHHLGNKRAKQLERKNLIREMRWFYDTAIVLRQRIEYLTTCLRGNKNPIFPRPRLPTR